MSSRNVLAQDSSSIVLPDGTVWKIPEHPLSGRIQPPDELIPRVCIVPDYAFSSGFEAIELAASAGLALEPWEQLALILGLGETAEGRWAAFQVTLIVARQNGKGAILEALDLYWLFATGERLIGHTAHEYRTAMEAFRRTVFLIQNTDWMRKKVKKVINTNGEEGIELLNGQRLRFLARSKGAGRGFSFPKLKWDEGYALTEEQQEAQLPTLSAMVNAQLWITSSPPLTSDTGKPLFQARRKADEGAEGVVFMDYGLAGNLEKLEEIDLDDQALWLQANPNAPERISLEAMQRERASMSDRGFARERLCIWPPDLDQGFTVISKEQWAAMADRFSGSSEWPAPENLLSHELAQFALQMGLAAGDPPMALTGRPCICADVSPRIGGRVTASVGLASERRDGLRHIELIRSGSGSDWAIAAMVHLVHASNALIALDPGSPAGSLLADLKTALKDSGISDPDTRIILMGSRDVAQAFGMIYDAASRPMSEDRTVVHLGQEELTLAVGGADKRKVGDGHAWDRSTAATDITGLISVTNALWGLANMPAEEVEPWVMFR